MLGRDHQWKADSINNRMTMKTKLILTAALLCVSSLNSFANAESYFLIGKAAGEGIKRLLK
jgi:hypothetical protein